MSAKWNMLALAGAIALWQASYYFHVNLWVPLFLTLLMLIIPRYGSYRFDRTVLQALYLGVILDILLILPAALTSSIKAASFNFTLQSVTYPILFSFLVAGNIGKRVVESFRTRPVVFASISALAYVLLVTPLGFFFNERNLAQLLMFNVAPIIILSIFLSYLYVKTDENNLSTSVFLSVYNIIVVFGLSISSTQLLYMIWQIVSIGAVMIMAEVIIQDSYMSRRVFKSRRVLYQRNEAPGIYMVVVAIAVVMLLFFLPTAMHQPTPVMADPTSSMEPEIQQGSLLLVSHAQLSQLKDGQILVFHAPWDKGVLYAHEIVSVIHENGTEYFKTAGINNPVADPALVPASAVVGVVAYHVPYLGYILIYQYLTIAVILLAVFLAMFWGSRKI